MTIGVRGKLFLLALLLLSIGYVAAELLLVPRLETAQLEMARRHLERLAYSARDALEATGSVAGSQQVAARLGRLLNVRVTFIDAAGRVVGESRISASDLPRIENHADRPEVIEARTGSPGTAMRLSATTGLRFLYVAAPPSALPVVSRAALPLTEVDANVARLRGSFRIATGFGLLVAAAISTLASHVASSRLRELTGVATGLARGDFSRRARAASGDEIGALGSALNALSSDLEHAHGALTRERDLLEAVLNAMTEGVLVTDSAKRILRVNPAAEALLAIGREVSGASILDATRQAQLADHVATVHDSGAPATHELELAGPPRRIIQLSSACLAGGRGVVSTFHDVSELRRLERTRQDFVANVSHELRTPVATLQAAGETLLGGALEHPARAREFTEMVARNAERLGRLVSDLLDLARLDAGEVELATGPIELAAVVDRTLEGLRSRAEKRRITVVNRVEPGLAVYADARALEQILTNLIDNAVKYTPEGGAAGVRTRETSAGRVRVEVWNSGEGIAPSHRPRVFERFYRVDPGRSRELGGTGLGLAIVRHLAEAMGGEVGVDERPSGGSILWFTIASA